MATVTVSGEAHGSLKDQVADGVIGATRKWFSLQENVLDGTYHPMPANGAEQVGWWGAALSDATGSFATVQRVIIEEIRSVHTLRVVGDEQLNEYPVDFTVELYNGDTLLYTATVTGNNQVTWQQALSSTYDVTKIVVSITRVNKASRSVKLTEVINPFVLTRGDVLKSKTDEATQINVFVNKLDAFAVAFRLYEYYNSDEIVDTSRQLDDVKLVDDSESYGTTIMQYVLGATELGEYSLPVTASFTKSDALLPKIVDSSFFTQYEFRRSDVLLSKMAEVTLGITANFTKQDALLPKVTESKRITVSFTKGDTVLVSRNIEADQITVNLTRPDTLLPRLAELSTPTNVHTKMDEDARTIYGKVEITYTDPFIDPYMTVTASSTAHGTYIEQVADNVTQSKYKWFSLHENKLDGTYHPLSADKKYSVGWWSGTSSDTAGVFAVPPTLTIVFEQPRPVYELKVVGDSLLNNYPVDFAIRLYDINSTLLYEEIVTSNTQPTWYKDIGDVLGVKKMVLTISKINKPNQPAKIMEFYTAVVETYEGDKIESISLLEELEYPSASVQLGAISSNEVDITLDNTDGKFNLGNVDSPLNGMLKQNRKVRTWLGVEVVPGQIEWHLLGVFWTVLWKIPDQSVWVHTTARDRLELLRQTDFETSQVYTNYSLYQLFELVLRDAGLTTDDYYVDPSLQSIIVPYAWFDRISHRDALQQLAGMAMVQVYCDRNGKVKVEKTLPTSTVIYAFDDDKNLYNKDFPSVWNQITNYVEVVATQWSPGASTIVCDSGQVITVPAGKDVEVMYAFSSVPVVGVQAPVITAGPNIQVYSYTVYAWGMKVIFRNIGTASEQVTRVQINGQLLEQKSSTVVVAKDDLSIRDIGKIKVTIQHNFIQDILYAQNLANELLNQYKNARHDIVMNARGNIALNLGDRVTAPSYLQNVRYEYMVKRQEIKWAGSLEATVEGQKV